MEINSNQVNRKRKFFMVLPLLVLPFLTGIFWAMGGGKDTSTHVVIKKGFNMEFPAAYLPEDKGDKMSYYQKAAIDSLKLIELRKRDPNNDGLSGQLIDHFPDSLIAKYGTALKASPNNNIYAEEAIMYQKLEQLHTLINTPVQVHKESSKDRKGDNSAIVTPEVNQLHSMMHTMKQQEADPEMDQLNGMLDKIMDIQHPDRVSQKVHSPILKAEGTVFNISTNPVKDISLIEDHNMLDTSGYEGTIENKFYSSDDSLSGNYDNSIEAVVQENQTLVSGSIVKFRLLQNIYIDNICIPKNQFLSGVGNLNGERLQVNINTIRFQNSIFPIALTVYDLDGMEGIHIPGALSTEVIKQSSDRSLQNFGVGFLDPSIKAKAASAGIEGAKSLLSKKVKQVKVTLKDGYRVLLRLKK